MKTFWKQFGSYLLVAVLSTVATLAMVDAKVGLKPSKLDQLERLIDERFVEEADMMAAEDAAAAAMVDSLGDRWSYYLSAKEYETHMEQMNNAYVGVGITILGTPDSSGYEILAVAADGPAQEAGIQVGDVLVAVEGQTVQEMDTAEVRDLVKGKEGTFVSLTVKRQEEELTFSVERRQVQTPVAEYEMLDGNIGLVTIVNFDSRCAQETIAAMEALLQQGAEKLIFDVRYNPGGYASELVKVLDYLLPEGELFRSVTYDGKESVDYSDADYLDIPMAVIVNAQSYSAAEFFAAALREYEAATVVGQQTVGKGYFQYTYRLNDGSAVGLSVGKYYTPKGISLAEVGITPDVVVELDEETASKLYYGSLDRSEDPQIQAAIEALQ